MAIFLVTWEIHIDDETITDPWDAARDAHSVMQTPGTTATVFTVTDQGTGRQWQVDLDEETVDELAPESGD